MPNFVYSSFLEDSDMGGPNAAKEREKGLFAQFIERNKKSAGEIKERVDIGNITFEAKDLEQFPEQCIFDEVFDKGLEDEFRMTGISRPKDASKNRWNFLFKGSSSGD